MKKQRERNRERDTNVDREERGSEQRAKER